MELNQLGNMLMVLYLAYLIYSYARRTFKDTDKRIIVNGVFFVCFNPYTFNLLAYDWRDSIQQVLCLAFLTNEGQK